MISFFFALIGLFLGSFINASIYRFQWYRDRELLSIIPMQTEEIKEQEKNITKKLSRRSHCDHCGQTLPTYALLPVISYLIFLGKSCCCKKKLPIKYPIIEAFCALWMYYCSTFSVDLITQIIVALFGIGLIGLALCDLKYKLVCDEHIDLLLFCVMCYLLTLPMITSTYLLGYILFYAVLKVLSKTFFLIYEKDCLGEGDVKVGAIIGLFHGVYSFSTIILLASIACLLAYLIAYCMKKNCLMEFPFLPFLNGASLLMIINNFGGFHLL